MEFDLAKTQYDELSSKYKFNNISFKQVNTYDDIDELINNINSIQNDKTGMGGRRCYDYRSSLVYLNPKFWNFCKKNQQVAYFSRIKEQSLPKQIETCLSRIYEYYVTKLDQTEKEVYDDVKIMAETNNRHAKRILITNFIKKWTQKDKNIAITL
jgi:hypothetical protein